MLHDDRGVLMGGLAAAETPAQQVELAFLATLGRLPTAREHRVWDPALVEDGSAAVRDLVWTLVNAQEFRFVR